ncbi:MAG: hypothetical protein ACI4XW_02095 [Candidatus Spyradocola sp.]
MDLNNWGAMPGTGGDDYHAFTSTTKGMKTGGGKAKPNVHYEPATAEQIIAVLLSCAVAVFFFVYFLLS